MHVFLFLTKIEQYKFVYVFFLQQKELFVLLYCTKHNITRKTDWTWVQFNGGNQFQPLHIIHNIDIFYEATVEIVPSAPVIGRMRFGNPFKRQTQDRAIKWCKRFVARFAHTRTSYGSIAFPKYRMCALLPKMFELMACDRLTREIKIQFQSHLQTILPFFFFVIYIKNNSHMLFCYVSGQWIGSFDRF